LKFSFEERNDAVPGPGSKRLPLVQFKLTTIGSPFTKIKEGHELSVFLNFSLVEFSLYSGLTDGWGENRSGTCPAIQKISLRMGIFGGCAKNPKVLI